MVSQTQSGRIDDRIPQQVAICSFRKLMQLNDYQIVARSFLNTTSLGYHGNFKPRPYKPLSNGVLISLLTSGRVGDCRSPSPFHGEGIGKSRFNDFLGEPEG